MASKVICAYCAIGHPPTFCLLEIEGGCLSNDHGPSDSGNLNELLSFAADDMAESSGQDELSGNGEPRIFKDPISTGRKRAAELYPIATGQVCSWAWKKNCGGGVETIYGCTGRPATNIHHGPDKSTFANEASNISVICTFCHNRWHAANDRYYPQPRPADGSTWLPIVPADKELIPLEAIQKATKEEILLEELKRPEGGKDKK